MAINPVNLLCKSTNLKMLVVQDEHPSKAATASNAKSFHECMIKDGEEGTHSVPVPSNSCTLNRKNQVSLDPNQERKPSSTFQPMLAKKSTFHEIIRIKSKRRWNREMGHPQKMGGVRDLYELAVEYLKS